MSLAGPHGEAACRYCNTLVDLREDGTLAPHWKLAKPECPGSRERPTESPKELPELAFNSDPVTRHCPHCGQLVVVNTVGASHRSGWRYQYHKTPQLKAAKAWGQPPSDCPHSGQLVYLAEDPTPPIPEWPISANPF